MGLSSELLFLFVELWPPMCFAIIFGRRHIVTHSYPCFRVPHRCNLGWYYLASEPALPVLYCPRDPNSQFVVVTVAELFVKSPFDQADRFCSSKSNCRSPVPCRNLDHLETVICICVATQSSEALVQICPETTHAPAIAYWHS